ncbi:MAG: HDOD domain-containing protein [Proteobacteria bacterium]|nr:HDOD domain-containing protein [Pseudomonadota bacterium]
MENYAMRGNLLSRAADLKVIPTLSTIIDKVFAVLSNKNSSFSDLSDVIKYDQAISSKVISIANSAYYSRGIEIYSLQRAMINIGYEEVKGIITCLLFMESILKQLKLKEEDLLVLWKHSMYVACASKILSEKTFVEDPMKVYTIALLHDIGKIVFYMSADNYSEIVKEAGAQEKSITQMEKERFGIDHQETGYAISLKWKFPLEFSHVIRYHHENSNETQYESLLNLIRVADRFSVSPNSVSGTEGYILMKEKDTIAKELKNIMDTLCMA